MIKPGGTGSWQRLQEPYLPEKWDSMNLCCLTNGTESSTAQPLTIPAGKYFLAKAFVRVLPLGHFGLGTGPTLVPAASALVDHPAAPAIVLAIPCGACLSARRRRRARRAAVAT